MDALKAIFKSTDKDGEILSYQVEYEITHNAQIVSFSVCVRTSEMSDPADLAEMEAIADVKAARVRKDFLTTTFDKQITTVEISAPRKEKDLSKVVLRDPVAAVAAVAAGPGIPSRGDFIKSINTK